MFDICQDMVIIHRVFRRELPLLAALVRSAPAGDRERAERLGSHLDLVIEVLEHHHEGEDVLLWPLLRERVPERAELFDRLESQHDALHDAIARVTSAAQAWRQAGAPSAADELAAALDDLEAPLIQHLDLEEAEVCPLIDRVLTAAEWGRLGERAFSQLAPDAALVVLAQMAEDSPAEEWGGFMPHLPVEAQQAFTEHARPVYASYLAEVRGA